MSHRTYKKTKGERFYSPFSYAYKSSSPFSSVNPAFPEAAPAVAPDDSPSGNLKLFPNPLDCCRFYNAKLVHSRLNDTQRAYLREHLVTSNVLVGNRTTGILHRLLEMLSKISRKYTMTSLKIYAFANLVIWGTGSSSSTSSSILSSPAASSFSCFSRVRLISASMDSLMANFAAR